MNKLQNSEFPNRFVKKILWDKTKILKSQLYKVISHVQVFFRQRIIHRATFIVRTLTKTDYFIILFTQNVLPHGPGY